MKMWDAANGRELRTFGRNDLPIVSVSFSPDGKAVASGSVDRTVKLWNVKSGRELRTLVKHTRLMIPVVVGPEVTFSPDGKLLAGGGEDNTIKLWDVRSGQELRALKGHTASINSVSFSLDGKLLASGSDDATVRLWDVDSGRELRILRGHTKGVTSTAFSRDGKLLGSSGRDKTTRLWDVGNGRELRAIEEHTDSQLSIAFSPDRRVLASRNNDNTIKLWDVESGSLMQSYKWDDPRTTTTISALVPDFYRFSNSDKFNGYEKSEAGLTSPDGRWLVKVGENGRINLYEAQTGNLRATLVALDERDWAVVTPDGLFDASAGARKLMHYAVGFESVSLEQMKDLYYVPRLLQKIFRGDPLPDVELFTAQDLFPAIEYEPSTPGQKQLTIKLRNRGGGIGLVEVLVNNSRLPEDSLKFTVTNPNEAVVIVDLTGAPLKAGKRIRSKSSRATAPAQSARAVPAVPNLFTSRRVPS